MSFEHLSTNQPRLFTEPESPTTPHDWTVLRNQKDRFEKINFDAIPC
jgi:hypothetical protein